MTIPQRNRRIRAQVRLEALVAKYTAEKSPKLDSTTTQLANLVKKLAQ